MNIRLIILTSFSVITSVVVLIVILNCGDIINAGYVGDGAIAIHLSPKIIFVIGFFRLLFSIQLDVSNLYKIQELLYSSLLYVILLIDSGMLVSIFTLLFSILILIIVVKQGLGVIEKRDSINW